MWVWLILVSGEEFSGSIFVRACWDGSANSCAGVAAIPSYGC